MSMEIKISDEILMAYADGELDASQAAQVEQAMQHDADIATRVAQHRALRAQLQNSFAAVLSEPVPEHLLNTLQPRATATTTDNIVDLTQARQRKAAPPGRSWSSREWLAMAASLLVGIVVGVYALNFNSANLVSARDGALVAQGKLATALTTQLASTGGNEQAIQIGVSFRNHAGEYCRSFAVQDERALAGLACRSQDNWRVQMLTESAVDSASEFRQAGSTTPAAVLALIDQQIEGEPLDDEAEAAAQRADWQ